MKTKELTDYLESIAPLSLQESYDNAGLIVGNPENEISAALICLDSTEEVIDEAIRTGCNLVIAHHPIIFSGLKKLNGKNYVERTIIKAIKNNISIYAIHTNLDNVSTGVNLKIGQMLGLKEMEILSMKKGVLKKLVTFCPLDSADKVREAMFAAGAGGIGNYDSCSFNVEGFGTFRGGEGTQPFVGKTGELHREPEVRIEVIFENQKQHKIFDALFSSHPYEEVAYDIYQLENQLDSIGSGMIGSLPSEMSEKDFLKFLKSALNTPVIRHTILKNKPVQKIAVCGGSGSFLLQDAIRQKADVFITADFKYHQFFDADGQIIIADIGHYESEQFTKELLQELILKKFPTFAVHLTGVNTNPVNYC